MLRIVIAILARVFMLSSETGGPTRYVSVLVDEGTYKKRIDYRDFEICFRIRS